MPVVGADVRASAGAIQLCAGQEAGVEAAVHAMHSLFNAESTEAVLLTPLMLLTRSTDGQLCTTSAFSAQPSPPSSSTLTRLLLNFKLLVERSLNRRRELHRVTP